MPIPNFSITLGYFLGDHSYPASLRASESAISRDAQYPLATIFHAVMGPLDLLTQLENWLGLPEYSTCQSLRVARCMYSINSLINKSNPTFYEKSFKTAPFACSKRLRSILDSLLLAGWEGSYPEEGGRLKDLSNLLQAIELREEETNIFIMGFPERIKRIHSVLSRFNLPVALKIELLEPRNFWPNAFKRLLSHLEEIGVKIHDAPDLDASYDVKNTVCNTNLALVQRYLTKSICAENAPPKSEDDSLVLLTTETEDQAAEAVAATLPLLQSKGQTVLLKTTQSFALDESLKCFHAPRADFSSISSMREILEILPLALQLRWTPGSMQALLDFLLLQISPIPDQIAFAIASEIKNHPGVNPKKWFENKKIQEYLKKMENEDQDIWNQCLSWIAPDFQQKKKMTGKEKKGMHVSVICDVCEKIIKWVETVRQKKQKNKKILHALPFLTILKKSAHDFMSLVRETGKEYFSRPVLDTMLEEILSEGTEYNFSTSEASPWICLEKPGQIFGPIDTLIWWLFVNQPQSPDFFWSKDEEDYLTERNMMPETSKDRLNLEYLVWKRAFLSAKKVILVIPERLDGEPIDPHPLYDFVVSALGGKDAAASLVQRFSEYVDFHDLPRSQVSPLSIPQEPSDPPELKDGQPSFLTGSLPVPKKIYVTTADDIIECPFRGLLESYNLAKSNILLTSFPKENILLGNFSHVILQDMIIDKNRPMNLETAESYMKELIKKMLPTNAAFLMEPSNYLIYDNFIIIMNGVAKHLCQMMNALDNPLAEVEKDLVLSLKTNEWSTDLVGRADVVLQKRDNLEQIIIWDLKWSKKEDEYKKKIDTNTAFQLAAYVEMKKNPENSKFPLLMSESGKEIFAAYWLLPLDLLIGQKEACVSSPKVSHVDFTNMWTELSKKLVDIINLWHGEKGFVPIPKRKDGKIPKDAPCSYCELSFVCGRGYAW